MNQQSQNWLSVGQAAQAFGLHKSTIRRLIASNQLPASRIGKKTIRINRNDLVAALRPYVGGEK